MEINAKQYPKVLDLLRSGMEIITTNGTYFVNTVEPLTVSFEKDEYLHRPFPKEEIILVNLEASDILSLISNPTALVLEWLTKVDREIIQSIELFEESDAGYIIKTNMQEIQLLIWNESNCCEQWGYFMSEDDLTQFIGAELIAIELVDTCLNVRKLEAENLYRDETALMFVNLKTNKGLLQFVAYNSHNGYYGHTAKVVSKQLTYETVL